MSTTAHPLDNAGTGNNKPLWVAIGVLAAAVMAMGGTLLYMAGQQSADAAAAPTAASAPGTLPSESQAAASSAQPLAPSPTKVAVEAPPRQLKPEQAHDNPDKPVVATAAKPVAKPAHRPATTSTPAPEPAGTLTAPTPASQPAPARQVCLSCGRVESVVSVERAGQGSGLGAVGGGVLGAVVGNQIGGGNGKTAATILGAIGGGVLGNTVEKRVRKQVAYQIGVRMEDGSYRTLERAAAVPVGSQVTLEGNTLRTSDGAVVPTAPVTPPAAAAQEPVYTGG